MKILDNISIKTRLVFVISFLSFLLIVGGLIGIINLSIANDVIRADYESRLVPMEHLHKMINLINSNQLAVALSLTADTSTVSQDMQQIDTRLAEINSEWQNFSAVEKNADEKSLAGKFNEAHLKLVQEGLTPAMTALRAGNIAEATRLVRGPMPALVASVQDAANALNLLNMNTSKKDFEKSQFIYHLVRNSCITGIILGIIISAFIGRWLIGSISLPLEAAVRTAKNVAAGNLTNHIETTAQDETGQLMRALKEMTESLVNIVDRVRVGTTTIVNASNEIVSGNHDLSARTEQQAHSLQETASSMEVLTATVKQNADSAQTANQLAQSASEFAVKGGVVVHEVVETMTSINESSKKIVDIIGVIDSIAFQTNILALNAAVEAARAGEQGRGFAVVATEVRQLAQRSAAAAKEIKNLIDDSVQKVHAGAKLVDQAGATMEDIVSSVKRVTDIMGEITTASKEQANGIDQVNRAINHMDESTQQNAALVEQSFASAESLKDQAFELANVVSIFVLNDASASAARALESPAVRASQSNTRLLVAI